MPGKLGVKLIPRKSISGKFHSVKELVFALFEKKPTISKDEVEKIVRKEYPKARFFGYDGRGGHFTYYKHKWNKMKLEDESFNIKETKQQTKEEEAGNGRKRDEGKKDKTKRTKGVEPKTVGKGGSRTKNRRVPIQPKKRKVVKQTREAPIQREGSDEANRQPKESEELSH